MSTDEYVPSEARVCIDYCNAAITRKGPGGEKVTMEEADRAFDRFLARVRRDAGREALTSMEEEHAEKAEKARVGGNATMYSIELIVAEAARQHRDTRHPIPEESP